MGGRQATKDKADMKLLADWLGWWIETHCTCGHLALVPVRMLVDQLGGAAPLDAVRGRLRCSKCGLLPALQS